MHTRLVGGFDIELTVVEEDNFGRVPVQAFTGEGIDARVGLGHVDFMGIDDKVAEFIKMIEFLFFLARRQSCC